MTLRHDAIPETALDWFRAGRGAALATVIETWGSAPRRVGSQLAISGDGEMAGSVSGGCVEGAVVIEAQDLIATGGRKVLEFGVSDDEAFAVGLACGGRIRVLVETVGTDLPEALLADLVAARAERRPVAYCVDLASGARRLRGPQSAAPELAERFARDASGVADGIFYGLHNPPLRLCVVGAVHIAQGLVQMAAQAGYDCVVIDPRPAFASAARFPGERLMDDWPDAAVAAVAPDLRTAVVTLSHDPKIDDPALIAALATPAFYVGALGSTRTHAKRLDRLGAAGVSPDNLKRIHGPVGLDIGAATPAEIAVSIMAQMTSVLRQGA